ncbi:hypothetical protein [Rurimicrobium arvi]|uniref:Uncharacterized protein n=1 Tax=Rurimicrobium arvi TaxID=2049916 RepID=A0ABP8MDE4_9BACT
MKNAIKKPKGAGEKFGIKITVDKKLDPVSKKPLFASKLDRVNAIIASLQHAH